MCQPVESGLALLPFLVCFTSSPTFFSVIMGFSVIFEDARIACVVFHSGIFAVSHSVLHTCSKYHYVCGNELLTGGALLRLKAIEELTLF